MKYHFHHIVTRAHSLSMTVADTDLDHLVEVVSSAVKLIINLPSFHTCWKKEIILQNPLMRRHLGTISQTAEHLCKLFGILHMKFGPSSFDIFNKSLCMHVCVHVYTSLLLCHVGCYQTLLVYFLP